MSILNSGEIKKVNRYLKKVLKYYNIKSDIDEFFSSKENSEVIADILIEIYELLKEPNNQVYLNTLFYLDEKGILDATYILGVYYEEMCSDLDTSIKWYKKAADNGYVDAQYSLGCIYHIDKKEYNEAKKWYELAIRNRSINSLNNLGLIYEDIEKDYDKAFDCYLKAANQGNEYGQYNLGRAYFSGLGVDKNYNEAKKWYELAISNGSIKSLNNLGLIYEDIEKDYDKAFDCYLKAANQESAEAQYNLGRLYFCGLGVDKNYDEAYKYYKLASDQGVCDAQNGLGMIYHFVKHDYDEAKKWYELAINNGSTVALNNIGALYQNIYNDLEKAFDYFVMAAEKNIPIAQSNIGQMYLKGLGVDEDLEAAKKWLSKAAENGVTHAMTLLGIIMLDEDESEGIKLIKEASDNNDYYGSYKLGLMYYEGEYFLQSYDKAKQCFEKAVYIHEHNEIMNQNQGEAYYNLGYIYFKGLTNDKNYELSKAYFEKAIELGYECKYALEMVQRELGSSIEENVIRNIYNDSFDIDNFINHVEKYIENDLFDDNAKIFLHTALEIYYLLLDRKINNSKERDFSSSTTPLLKAFEHIIKEEIVKKYGKYLEEKSSYDTLKTKKIDKFTLGNFKQFLSINEETFSGSIGDGNISFDSRIQIKDKELFEFLKTEIFDLSKFSSDNAEYELINYLWNLVQEVKQINDFRIDSVHNEVISIDYAETTFNYLLFNQKVISNFLNKLKRK